MVDFKKLRESKTVAAPSDPVEIFRRLPKPPGINDLYASQNQVLAVGGKDNVIIEHLADRHFGEKFKCREREELHAFFILDTDSNFSSVARDGGAVGTITGLVLFGFRHLGQVNERDRTIPGVHDKSLGGRVCGSSLAFANSIRLSNAALNGHAAG